MTMTEIESAQAAQAPQAPQVRFYGGWRLARGMGLMGLNQTETMVVLAAIVLPLLVTFFSIKAGLITAVPCALVAAATAIRVNGESVATVTVRHVRWWRGRTRGYQSLRAGTLVEHPGAWQLPGPLAAMRLLSSEDGRGGRFGLVWDQRSGFLTSTLRCAARTSWLADDEMADGWVAQWHHWLASLGYKPMVAWVAVHVETAPDPMTSLAEYVSGRMSPNAPPLARKIMAQVVSESPEPAAEAHTWVSVTFDPSRSQDKLTTLPEQTAEISQVLHGLEGSLAACGVGGIARAQDWELAGIMRSSFDPAARGEVQRLITRARHHDPDATELLTWGEAGPLAHEEHWDYYVHDSGISVVWGWHEAPRQQVPSNVLSPLLCPGRFPKRATMLYRVYPAAHAADRVESEVNAAEFQASLRKARGRDATARDDADMRRAKTAAVEEALGAGLARVTMYVTTTVIDINDLPAAVEEVETRAGEARIRLRRLRGSQLAGFCATLPAGVHPTVLAARTGK